VDAAAETATLPPWLPTLNLQNCAMR
jgi:hypothetical protein